VSTKGKFERKGYPVTTGVLSRVGATLATVVQGVEAGVFPNYPTGMSTTPYVECHYCDPDTSASLNSAASGNESGPIRLSPPTPS
jgi:hypothetical protein